MPQIADPFHAIDSPFIRWQKSVRRCVERLESLDVSEHLNISAVEYLLMWRTLDNVENTQPAADISWPVKSQHAQMGLLQ